MDKESPDRPRPYVRAFAGSEEDFPTYILKTLGKDRTWMDNGACRDHELVRKNAWTCRPSDRVRIAGLTINAKELVRAALMVCSSCPAQYQCARWAHQVEEESGTWSMEHDHLLWLIRQDDGADIINRAETEQRPVQVVVKETIQIRRREARAERRRQQGVASDP